MTRTISKKKKFNKAKWLSEEDLQIAEKRSERQRRRERYTHFNSGFQRIKWRSKKPFLSEQGKGIEGKDRTGKIRDLLKKIRDTKGTFHAKMGTKKVRNSKGLTETEEVKKR